MEAGRSALHSGGGIAKRWVQTTAVPLKALWKKTIPSFHYRKIFKSLNMDTHTSCEAQCAINPECLLVNLGDTENATKLNSTEQPNPW